MDRISRYLLLLLLLFILSFTYQDTTLLLRVSKVVDGDTIWVINEKGQTEKIRFIGMNTPEPISTSYKGEEYYGKEASDYVKKLLDGEKVRLEYDVQKYDRYGRTLAYVYLEDNTFLNAHLVEQGYATVMTIPPNVKFADEFVRLQAEAREKKLGLWAKKIE